MNYAAIKPYDIANGPGVRVSLFVSGCTHRCKDCFNSEAWSFDYGLPFTQKTRERIIEMLSHDYIAGLSILGGEPWEPVNRAALVDFVEEVKRKFPTKTIWSYSGYTLEEILSDERGDRDITRRLLGCTDVLVDGKFVADKKDITLLFRGSSNQRLIDIKKTLEKSELVLWTPESQGAKK